MIAAMIIACEIGFWVFVLAGLAFRYLLGMRRLGAVLLACTILIDLALLVFATIDIKRGATAGFFHGLAAIYVAVSLVFGKQMIRWADGKFAHRFAGMPAPAPKPKYGAEHARYERIMWFKHLLAWLIGSAILAGLSLYIGDAGKSRELQNMIPRWAVVLGIDFLISFSYTIWPRREKADREKAV